MNSHDPDLSMYSNDDLVALYHKTKEEERQYDLKQMAQKISLNSCYGALGNQYFRHYDLRLATSITLTGQLSIQWIASKLNKRFNSLLGTNAKDYVAYIDTDSVHINAKEIVNQQCKNKTKDETIKFLEQLGSVVEDIIDDEFDALGKVLNNHENSFHMAPEAISDKAIWTGKKRYVLNMVVKDGRRMNPAKAKIMGLEIKRSSTPDIIKPMLEKSISVILKEDNASLLEYIDECKAKFFSFAPEDIAFPRGVSDITKYKNSPSSAVLYKKGTPIAVRAAIMYNSLIEKMNLTTKYSKMEDGTKIKFIYLKLPNTIQENVVGFLNAIPEEFALNDYIDYQTQFEKSFLEPVTSIAEAVGWTTDNTPTLF